MIRQGIAELDGARGTGGLGGLSSTLLSEYQTQFTQPSRLHAIEVRVYCENPAARFQPTPGLLQFVQSPEERKGIRIDTWVRILGAILSNNAH